MLSGAKLHIIIIKSCYTPIYFIIETFSGTKVYIYFRTNYQESNNDKRKLY